MFGGSGEHTILGPRCARPVYVSGECFFCSIFAVIPVSHMAHAKVVFTLNFHFFTALEFSLSALLVRAQGCCLVLAPTPPLFPAPVQSKFINDPTNTCTCAILLTHYPSHVHAKIHRVLKYRARAHTVGFASVVLPTLSMRCLTTASLPAIHLRPSPPWWRWLVMCSTC